MTLVRLEPATSPPQDKDTTHGRIQRGGKGLRAPALKNHKNIGFLCNTGPDPLKNHKATNPAFNVEPPSACQGNAISMALHWQADDGPIKAISGSSIPPSAKKKGYQIRTPSDKTFWISKCHCYHSFRSDIMFSLVFANVTKKKDFYPLHVG